MRWRRHGLALAATVAAILLIFRADVVQLVAFWWTSESYGHCLFVPPIVAALVWQRRRELAPLTPAGWWPGLVIVAAGAGAWLMGEAASVTFARQLGLVVMLQGAVIATLGLAVTRGLLFPLAYAFFMVPFGEGLEAPLQAITVRIVMPLLALAGIPATSDGVMIHAGPYYFEVAEACSGARFVIAMVAVAALVCALCYSRWRRRAAFMAAAIVVPILANGVRAFATIYAAQVTSIEAAAGFDHIVFGWVFFGLVMAGILAGGWRWFDRPADAPAFDPARLQAPPRHRLPAWAAALATVAIAGSVAGWAARAGAAVAPLPADDALPAVPGWTRVAIADATPWRPAYPGADRFLIGRYRAPGGTTIDMVVVTFASQHRGKSLVGFGTGALAPDQPWLRVVDLPPIAGGATMRITAPGPVERVVATWYRVGSVTTADEKRVKIETMLAHLAGRAEPAVAIHLSAVARPGHDPEAAIRRFIATLGPPGAVGAR